MRKLLLSVAAFGLLLGSSSCTVTQMISVTDNPIGTKVGIAKTGLFKPSADFTLKKAANNGNIDKIGAAQLEFKYVLFIPLTIKTTVYGE